MVRLVILTAEAVTRVVAVPLTETWTAPRSWVAAVLSVSVWVPPFLKVTVLFASLFQVLPRLNVRLP